MAVPALADDLSGIRELLGQRVSEGMDELGSPDGPADLELWALNLIGPFAHPEMPVDAVSLLPEALLGRGDEQAAGVLAALAVLAPEPLAGFAADARDQLAADGVTSPFAESVGTLEARECYHLGLVEGEAEALGVLLQRPGESYAQAAMLFVEHVPCGGVVVDGLLTGPDDPDAARDLLRRPHETVTRAERVAGEELAESLSAALRHMVEHVLEIPVETVHALLVCERALTGQVGSWPRPLQRFTAGEARVRVDADALVEAFAAYLPEQEDTSHLVEYGPLVADALLVWKIDYADGRIDHWEVADLHEFLLDWYPRKGESEDELVRAVPDCISAFLRFLAEAEQLSGDSLETLTMTVTQLSGRFRDAARDPRNWGLAKSMVTAMRADGVDPLEPGEVEAWIDEFNARPFLERDRVVGPAADRALGAARAGRRHGDRRKVRRRAQKAARRRNRR